MSLRFDLFRVDFELSLSFRVLVDRILRFALDDRFGLVRANPIIVFIVVKATLLV